MSSTKFRKIVLGKLVGRCKSLRDSKVRILYRRAITNLLLTICTYEQSQSSLVRVVETYAKIVWILYFQIWLLRAQKTIFKKTLVLLKDCKFCKLRLSAKQKVPELLEPENQWSAYKVIGIWNMVLEHVFALFCICGQDCFSQARPG